MVPRRAERAAGQDQKRSNKPGPRFRTATDSATNLKSGIRAPEGPESGFRSLEGPESGFRSLENTCKNSRYYARNARDPAGPESLNPSSDLNPDSGPSGALNMAGYGLGALNMAG